MINSDLMEWYVVRTLVVDVTKAKVNGIEIGEWTLANGNARYNLAFSYSDDGDGGTFTFTNNGELGKALTITVPVTVSSKWQTWTETITISVPKAE